MSVLPSQDRRPDAVGRLWWALRHHVRLFVGLLGAVTLLALVLGPGLLERQRSYRAEALVVARQLTIAPHLLPRFGEEVFRGGAVAAEVVEELGLSLAPQDVIPDHVDIEPIEDSILLRVVGTAADPDTAARLANASADALIDEMNKAGLGVGLFALQESARPPSRPQNRGGAAVSLLVGLVGGAALALGTVGLLAMVRRPVHDPTDVASLTEASVLPTIVLPGGKQSEGDPTRVLGLWSLVAHAYPDGSGTCVFLACRGAERARTAIAQVVARALERYGPVTYVSTLEEALAPGSAGGDPLVDGDDPTSPGRSTVVIDGPVSEEVDVAQYLTGGARCVVVVHEGAPRAAVQRAVSWVPAGQLSAVALVRRRSGRRRPLVPVRALSGRQPAPDTGAPAETSQVGRSTG